ncbi:class I SAM-dependent methyltransferase [Pseudoduganella lutea]|uniref:Methyltransferase n=1 Tax=Pseudoduganella lutea TaxID=321985 RepID=A0A4P6KXT7_9BURK|nr:class I SAM-dependent methyltransferase [Pseudoduganella lutea]QBE64001.1 methyltransferase [Pseudoduganella lutea]
MPEWSAGYVADIGYTYGTYPELNPHRLRLAFLSARLTPPAVTTACELGFGQGLSVNIHAAASNVAWHGTDFNPAQAGFAQELAAASGADVALHDEAFAQFCSRTDLPEFDFIGLHGIFSWISDENRRVVVDFIRRKLKVGGVLYISYNTQPGWAAMAPVRDLLNEYATTMTPAGAGSAGRVGQSIAFAERLFATAPTFLTANPRVASRFAKLKDQNHAYLAHEYFNRDWMPYSFSQMAGWLEPAKLDYACSAHYLDNIDPINLTAEQRQLLGEIADPVFAQTVRDYMVNQSFRRDYWVKGARRLGAIERDEQLLRTRIVLTTPRADVPMKAAGRAGEVRLQAKVYEPLLDFLADQEAHTIGAFLEVARERHGLTSPQVVQAVTMLVGMGHVATLQEEAVIAHAGPQARRLNQRLCELAMSNTELQWLALPGTGGAFPADRFHLLFLLARMRGAREPEAWASFAHQVLVRQGQRLMIDGKPAETDGHQLDRLVSRALEFRDKTLPLLARLGAVG